MPTFYQSYPNHTPATLQWTQNGGVFPSPYASQVKVYQNGQLLIPVTQYTIAGAVITVGADTHFATANYAVYAESDGTNTAVIGSGVQCLSGLVGLDRNPCECYEDDRPSDYNVSASGYYLTDPEYGVQMRDGVLGAKDCGQGSMWDVLARARTAAIADFQVDLYAAVLMGRNRTFTAFSGMIGQATANRTNRLSNAYAGQVFKPRKRMRHNRLVITAVYLGRADSGNVDVVLNSNAFDFTPLTVTVAATGGRFVKHTLATPWVLDMYQQEVMDLYYTISYRHDGIECLSNRFWCCGATPSWVQELNVFGFSDDNPTRDFEGSTGNSDVGNGLALECHFECDDLAWVCELDVLGGKNMRSLIGRVIQYKATVKILSQMLESGSINQYSLLNREDGFARMNHSQERYNELITWIVQNLPSGFSGCFGCKKNTFDIQPIRV